MRTVDAGSLFAEPGARAPRSAAARFGMVRGRTARPAPRRCTPEQAACSGLRVIGGFAARAEDVRARKPAVKAWVKALWVGTVLVSAGAIWLGAL